MAGILHVVRTVGKERSRWEALTLIRLHVLAEGQTEEGFVNEILAPVLASHNIVVDVHCITTGRHRGKVFRGGFVNYEHLARDLALWMKQDQNEESWFTTMVDLYALPQNFPGLSGLTPTMPGDARIAALEAALLGDMSARLDGRPVTRRFIPYIQLHEFETLLFAQPPAFLRVFPDSPAAVKQLTVVRVQFPNPEEINNDPRTAPSKRILDVFPDYQKPVAGLLVAQHIGLAAVRSNCKHFDAWVTQILELARTP